MKKSILYVSAVLACALIAALYRFFITIPIGEGRGIDSPDGKFMAEAMSREGEKFWGGKMSSYEFTITSTNGNLISHCILNDPPRPLSDWYNDGDHLILWETNNSSVTFNFTGGHLNLSVKP